MELEALVPHRNAFHSSAMERAAKQENGWHFLPLLPLPPAPLPSSPPLLYNWDLC